MDLHSEQRKRPAFVARNFFVQTGQAKIFGKRVLMMGAPALKKLTASSIESLILKNCEKPSN